MNNLRLLMIDGMSRILHDPINHAIINQSVDGLGVVAQHVLVANEK